MPVVNYMSFPMSIIYIPIQTTLQKILKKTLTKPDFGLGMTHSLSLRLLKHFFDNFLYEHGGLFMRYQRWTTLTRGGDFRDRTESEQPFTFVLWLWALLGLDLGPGLRLVILLGQLHLINIVKGKLKIKTKINEKLTLQI